MPVQKRDPNARVFFNNDAKFRARLQANHDSASDLHARGSGLRSGSKPAPRVSLLK